MKEWFKARNIWGAAIMALSDAEAGRLMKAVWAYTMTGEQQNLSGAEKGVFALILMTLSQDDARSNEISEKRAASGAIGGKQKAANLAIATFATDDIANLANATNKNKNKEIENKNKEREREKRAREDEISDRFSKFWAAYPRKENKKKAEDAFRKINPDDVMLARMLDSISKWANSEQWTKDGSSFIPHPSTWLNGRRWEDDPPKPASGSGYRKGYAAQDYEQRDYTGADLSVDETMNMLASNLAQMGGQT